MLRPWGSKLGFDGCGDERVAHGPAYRPGNTGGDVARFAKWHVVVGPRGAGYLLGHVFPFWETEVTA